MEVFVITITEVLEKQVYKVAESEEIAIAMAELDYNDGNIKPNHKEDLVRTVFD